ncbi:MAG TPA: hypothetical protein VG960_11060 [Caulobacteraceae bacterium]|nr:hypothetical protein [Caulobacteraceae bacterium]
MIEPKTVALAILATLKLFERIENKVSLVEFRLNRTEASRSRRKDRMLPNLLPPYLALILKVIAELSGFASAGLAWWAARLWLEASKVEIVDTTPRTQVSYEDSPALGILGVEVSGYATQAAYNASAALNARAARWTAWAAILAGLAAVLSR